MLTCFLDNKDIEAAKLYLFILENSPISIVDLTINSKNPNSSKINEKIKLLFDARLISYYTDREGEITYFCIDPKYTFSSIVISAIRKFNMNLYMFNDLEKVTDLNNLYKMSLSLLDELRPLYIKKLPFLKEIAFTLKDKNQIATYLCELLNNAEFMINAVISPPHLMGEIVWQTLIDKMGNGVNYYRVTTIEELLKYGFLIYKNEVSKYNEELYIYKQEKLSHKFYVIDNKTVIFFIPDTNNSEFRFEVQVISNESFAKRYLDVYKKFQNESLSLKEFIPNFEKYRIIFIDRASKFLTSDELSWLISVYDYGVFCKNHDFSYSIYNSAREKCINHKLVVALEDGTLIVNIKLEDILKND